MDAFGGVLAEIVQLRDPDCIGRLIDFLDDRSDVDVVMFSIIHTIEVFDHETYVKEVLCALPRAWRRAPDWTMCVVMRILNSAQ